MRLTTALEHEYRELYSTCEIRPDRFDDVDRIVDVIVRKKTRYVSVSRSSGVPWYMIGAIHNMESGLNFEKHLHNGDPLTRRTRRVPAGRPPTGEPPFTWEESAADALGMRRLDRVDAWTLSRLLFELEGYNGWGYRSYHPHVKSPYLWGFSSHYARGKYVADGTWSETAVSRQCGAAVIIRRLEQRAEVTLATGRTGRRPPLRKHNAALARADDLQRFLNTFEGISLRIDGWPGAKTSDAVKHVFGFYLHGDRRTGE